MPRKRRPIRDAGVAKASRDLKRDARTMWEIRETHDNFAIQRTAHASPFASAASPRPPKALQRARLRGMVPPCPLSRTDASRAASSSCARGQATVSNEDEGNEAKRTARG